MQIKANAYICSHLHMLTLFGWFLNKQLAGVQTNCYKVTIIVTFLRRL